MKFKRRKKASAKLTMLFVSLVVMVIMSLYYLNSRIMPTYLQYAEVQTEKVASYVVSKAINSRTSSVLDVNDIIVDLPPGTSDSMVTTKLNTDIINQVRAETTALVKEYLEQAENGDLSRLPSLENVEYDVGRMEAGDGIVFFVPMGQALNLPLLGNLGPTIPIRFHIIGNVHSGVESTIREFGINNAYVEVSIHLEVNVQIIIPFASKSTRVEQYIPVAIGLIRGTVPHIYTDGGEGVQPSLEVPIPYD
ncbi:sporulation protein YunB [Lysinibacillus sp. KU-BSD001]|uniref:sporulation protein YunB n=1 Tax=Lysinibacillus sp. KU-BSD001 TaxID=3141328 RepID=UPI0036EBED8C